MSSLLFFIIFRPAAPQAPNAADCVAHYQGERYGRAAACFQALHRSSRDYHFLYGAAYAWYMAKQDDRALTDVRAYRARSPKKGGA